MGRELFEQIALAAAHHGGRPAVVWDQGCLTYDELISRSGSLAASLQRRLRTDGPVGVALGERPDTVVTLLAIARLNRAFVPTDLSLPQARLEMIESDAGCAAMVTHPLPVSTEDSPRPGRPGPSAPAYVMYTSGSTGRPRGVVMSDSALIRHARAAQQFFGITSTDRVLQFASWAFDVAQEEVWPALLAGASIVARPSATLGLGQLHDAVQRMGVTILQLPTAYWRVWSAAIEDEDVDLPSLTSVIVGGEAATWADAQRWRRGPLARVRLFNAYGPTEVGITATAYEVPLCIGDQDPTHPLPIGRPLPGRTIELAPVAGGLELVVTGPCVADGYLGSERFGGAFRTGDLVSWTAEGDLVFRGRIDDQLKIRGWRIEPEEIAAAIRAVEGVADCHVIAIGAGDNVSLAAVYEVVAGASVSEADIRRACADRFPVAMMPSRAIRLDSLPRTPQGKHDRTVIRECIEKSRP
jgi:amino acid adenylation domain-containing protein